MITVYEGDIDGDRTDKEEEERVENSRLQSLGGRLCI
jgi:hypothetical protein